VVSGCPTGGEPKDEEVLGGKEEGQSGLARRFVLAVLVSRPLVSLSYLLFAPLYISLYSDSKSERGKRVLGHLDIEDRPPLIAVRSVPNFPPKFSKPLWTDPSEPTAIS
jgi:hypothetical protein